MSDESQLRALALQALTATTFVEIVETLVEDFDVIDVLTILTSRCVELVDAGAAGILLADQSGQLRVMAASNEQIELLELFQIQNDEGPCLDCFSSGTVVQHARLDADSPWPAFAAESVRAGFPAVCAVPLRLRDVTLGCLNLFLAETRALSDADVALAQALADVASIAIVQDQVTREAAVREGHLQHALNSRIAIEQAKGMIAERAGVDMDVAFSRLRAFARNNNRGLTEVAQDLVGGGLAIGEVINTVSSPAPGAARAVDHSSWTAHPRGCMVVGDEQTSVRQRVAPALGRAFAQRRQLWPNANR